LWNDWWNISVLLECQLCNVCQSWKGRHETCIDMTSSVKHFSYVRKEMFYMNHCWLRDLTMLCNINEHKRLAGMRSRGQSYDVTHSIKFYQSILWPNSFILTKLSIFFTFVGTTQPVKSWGIVQGILTEGEGSEQLTLY
jgi:hypothetical protein